jgi:hypothetical protein
MSHKPHATLHLRVLGDLCQVTVEVPDTPAQKSDAHPAARAITDATHNVAAQKKAAHGRHTTCKPGCDSCCHHLVAVTAPEIFLTHGELIGTWRDARLPAALAATAFYAWRPGVLGPLVAGLAVYMPLHVGLGW